VSGRRAIIPGGLIGTVLLAGSCAAWGQAASPSPSPAPFTPHGSEGMIQLVVYFLLILAFLAGGLYLTRFGFGSRPGKGRGERKLVISESRTLGNRQFLVVAEYEGRKMLLGVCPGRIDYLSTLAGGGDDTFSTDLPDKLE
jgi:flagellar biogenesis protein FliO